MPDSGQLRQLHMREVGWTDTEAFEQGVIQRLEPELMAEKLIFPPQQTVVMAGAELTYNVAHWKFGLEYTLSSAWYGSMDASNGKIKDTHSVCNNRIVGVAMFMF